MYKPDRYDYNAAVIRGDLPFPDERAVEPTCCVPDAGGACVWDCPRLKALRDYHTMDEYARGCVRVGGTAFTTYEDNGPVYCKELNRLCSQGRTA